MKGKSRGEGKLGRDRSLLVCAGFLSLYPPGCGYGHSWGWYTTPHPGAAVWGRRHRERPKAFEKLHVGQELQSTWGGTGTGTAVAPRLQSQCPVSALSSFQWETKAKILTSCKESQKTQRLFCGGVLVYLFIYLFKLEIVKCYREKEPGCGTWKRMGHLGTQHPGTFPFGTFCENFSSRGEKPDYGHSSTVKWGWVWVAVPCRVGSGNCLPCLFRNHLLQEGKEVDTWVEIRENLIPLVATALLWLEVEVYSL